MSVQKRVLNLSLVSLALLSANVIATEEANEIERIAIWSTKVKSSAPYLAQTEIADKQADHISDLLRAIPGVDVGGAHSLNQRITIRSMDDKDLRISIDGASQNTYMYHHMGNLQIHADILKSVEIYTGTNSVVNGGLGGTVRFTTKEAKDLLSAEQRLGGRVSASAGDNSGKQFSFTGYGQLTEALDFLAYFNDVSKDNFEVGGGKILDENGLIEEGTDGTVRGLEGDVSDVLVKFGWDIDDQQRIAISFERYEDKGNYSYRPDMGMSTDMTIAGGTQTPLTWPTEFTRDTATLNYDLDFFDTSLVRFSLFSNVSELKRDESGWLEATSARLQGLAGQVMGEAKNSGLNILGESVLEGLFEIETEHTLTYGLDHIKHETSYALNPHIGDMRQASEESTTTAIYVQDQVAFSRGVTVTPGVRYEQADIKANVIDETYDDVTFALSVQYQFNEHFMFTLSATELFQAPELSEVFTGAGLGRTANSTLRAEQGLNKELTIAYQASLGAVDYRAGATLFDTSIDNYIHDYAPYPQGGQRATFRDNIGDMENSGFELYVGYDFSQLELQMSYSGSNSKLDAFAPYKAVFDGARLDREQGNSLALDVTYHFDKLPITVNWEIQRVQALSSGLDLDGRAGKDNSKDGFSVHNLVAVWHPEFSNALEVRLGIDNLFDEFYASQSSRTGLGEHPAFGELYLLDYEPGRNIKATVSYLF